MKPAAWHLPWGRATVPHAVLDINRGCNIRCDACYNLAAPYAKPIAEVEHDLDLLLRQRRLSSVSIVGGEVLLHPDLCAIIRCVKARKLDVEICTNGVLLDARWLARLKAAGLDVVFLHIDGGQQRPDLPPHPTLAQLRTCWQEKTALAGSQGLDVGLMLTAYAGRLPEVKEIIAFTLASPDVNYLLITLYRDVAGMERITGDLSSGMQGTPSRPAEQRPDNLTNVALQQYLQAELGLRPFAYLGSNQDANDPRWLSYLVAAQVSSKPPTFYSLKASAFEKAFLGLLRFVRGRYPMYRRQSSLALGIELVLNGLAGGDLPGNLRFLAKGLGRGQAFRTKRLLAQCPAEIGKDGQVIHCVNCPDAVVKQGRLVPVCICDKITVPS